MSTVQPPATRNGSPPSYTPHRPEVPRAWSIPRTAEAVHKTRHFVAILAATVLGYSDVLDDLELMASELLTNAVDHGGGDHIHIAVTKEDGHLQFLAHDAGGQPTEADSHSADPDDLPESGRGQHIVNALATSSGHRRDATGYTAWFQVAIPEATP